MTLEGAIKFYEENSYIVYTMNSATTGQYCAVLPKDVSGVMNMLVDLHMKGLFDGVSAGKKTKEQLVEELGKEYLNVKSKYSNAMLVLPMIEEVGLQSAIQNNDKQKMFDEVKKIGAITSEIYKKLTDSGVEKQNIDQKIIIVEKQEDDGKFVSWLKEQMPNFVDGIRYSELEPTVMPVNPFMDNNVVAENVLVTPEVVVQNPIPSGNSIFDNAVSSTPVTPVNPVPPVNPEPVVSAPSVESTNVDIFGIPTNINGVAPMSSVASEPVVTSSNPVDPFAPAAPANPVPPVVSEVASAPVTEVPQPQPVNNVGLEGTTAFSPIPNPAPVVENNSVSTDEMVQEQKSGSKGFVNLIILVVVLIGVTIASIELGKFLYSVYGA